MVLICRDRLVDKPGITIVCWLSDILARARSRRQFYLCVSVIALFVEYEPVHNKTKKMTCAPSEDSDQPEHPPSLIRVFAVRFMRS